MDDEFGEAGIDAKRVLADIRKWKEAIKANVFMIEGALITLDAWLEEQK